MKKFLYFTLFLMSLQVVQAQAWSFSSWFGNTQNQKTCLFIAGVACFASFMWKACAQAKAAAIAGKTPVSRVTIVTGSGAKSPVADKPTAAVVPAKVDREFELVERERIKALGNGGCATMEQLIEQVKKVTEQRNKAQAENKKLQARIRELEARASGAGPAAAQRDAGGSDVSAAKLLELQQADSAKLDALNAQLQALRERAGGLLTGRP